ncbi:MAG: quinone-dependent dihydroorotate dehydrogenase [Patescibacteria group bacterium]
MSLYTRVIRPLLYRVPPDTIHPIVAGGSELVSRIPGVKNVLRAYFRVDEPPLAVTVNGIHFPNPVGLSAGFDKDGEFLHFEEVFGFGFAEIGSISRQPYVGNPKPWVRRMVRNKSLVVNYGLKSQGMDRVFDRMQNTHVQIPIGISLVKSNHPDCFGERAIADYIAVYEKFANVGDYYTLNLSCPNTPDGTPFTEPQALETLLTAIHAARQQHGITKPTFLKINPDISNEHLAAIVALAIRYDMEGLVIGNLIKDKTKARALLDFPEDHQPEWPGSLSGKPVRDLSTETIRQAYQLANGKLTLIGTGGIFTGDHAYAKIRAGASLVQLITGFIFGGPTTIRNINKRLLELLRRDGFRNISQAVGADHK